MTEDLKLNAVFMIDRGTFLKLYLVNKIFNLEILNFFEFFTIFIEI